MLSQDDKEREKERERSRFSHVLSRLRRDGFSAFPRKDISRESALERSPFDTRESPLPDFLAILRIGRLTVTLYATCERLYGREQMSSHQNSSQSLVCVPF